MQSQAISLCRHHPEAQVMRGSPGGSGLVERANQNAPRRLMKGTVVVTAGVLAAVRTGYPLADLLIGYEGSAGRRWKAGGHGVCHIVRK